MIKQAIGLCLNIEVWFVKYIISVQMPVMTDIQQRTIERELSALQKMEALCREGSTRTGKWVIKDKSFLN